MIQSLTRVDENIIRNYDTYVAESTSVLVIVAESTSVLVILPGVSKCLVRTGIMSRVIP
jgi:hypothetical protein